MASVALAGVTRPRRSTRVARSVPVFLAILFLAGIYSNVPLLLGSSGIPMVSALPGLLLVAPYFAARYFSRPYALALGLAALAVAISMFAPYGYEFMVPRLVAGGQTVFSFTIGFTVYWLAMSYPRAKISRFVLILVIVLLVGCALEVLTPLKVVTLAYTKLYGGEGVSQSDINRDLHIGGALRPKLFTSETSYVAMAVSYGIAAYVWTATRINKYMIAFALALAAFVVLRSPTVLGCLVPIAVDFVMNFVRHRRTRDYTALLLPLVLVATLVGTIFIGDYIGGLIDARLEGAKDGTDYSVTYRTYGSMAAGIAVANEHPLVGIGMASYEIAQNTIIKTEIGFGVPISAIKTEWRMSLNNAPSNSLIIWGYFGSAIIWTLALIGIGRLAGGFTPMLAVMIAILSMSDGAIYSPRYVAYLFIFMAINRVVRSQSRAGAPTTAQRRPAPPVALRPRPLRPV